VETEGNAFMSLRLNTRTGRSVLTILPAAKV
jgi:hypothetical protein